MISSAILVDFLQWSHGTVANFLTSCPLWGRHSVRRGVDCAYSTEQTGQTMTATNYHRMDSADFAKTLRTTLRRAGFTGSVRKGRGTAAAWTELTGSLPGGEFTNDERAVLIRLGFQPCGNIDLVEPDTRNAVMAAIMQASV